MKIAVATKKNYSEISGHAGQSRYWLIYDQVEGIAADVPLPEPSRLELTRAEVIHHFEGGSPHPLQGVSLILAGSAGDGFFRKMEGWRTEVRLTGERSPEKAIRCVLAGEPLPPRRFDITTSFCKLHDLFSKH